MKIQKELPVSLAVSALCSVSMRTACLQEKQRNCTSAGDDNHNERHPFIQKRFPIWLAGRVAG